MTWLQQGSRYDFRVRDANGRGTTEYPGLVFVGYGRWFPEVEHQLEFAVVVSDENDASPCHHVWNLDRILAATEVPGDHPGG
jgi:hypothetical protein